MSNVAVAPGYTVESAVSELADTLYREGWLENGEFRCIACGTEIGKNLLDERPFALVREHARECAREVVVG